MIWVIRKKNWWKTNQTKKPQIEKGHCWGAGGSTHLKLDLGRQKIVYIFMFSALQILLFFPFVIEISMLSLVPGTAPGWLTMWISHVFHFCCFLFYLFISLFVFKVPKSHCLLDQYKTCIRVPREKRYGISLHTSDGVEGPHYWVLCYTIVSMSSLFSPLLLCLPCPSPHCLSLSPLSLWTYFSFYNHPSCTFIPNSHTYIILYVN